MGHAGLGLSCPALHAKCRPVDIKIYPRNGMEDDLTESKDIMEPPKSAESPLVFISHDSRDADLAEAFSKLLKSVSAGMLKSFRSSDKRGTEGIEFGDEWYKAIMSNLDKASDVVCLLTERSLDRPWLLYEAGVAKGKLGTPVHGIALGIPLSRVSVGPFYQFQNSDDSEDELAKLILQLCRRIPGLEPDQSVVVSQVSAFKTSVGNVIKTMPGQKKAETKETVDEGSVAKVLEEMKLIVRELPIRLEERIVERTEISRPRRFPFRRFHPGMIHEMVYMFSKRTNSPIGILIIASFLRDDFPWLYEIGLDAYRTAKNGNSEHIREALKVFRDAAELMEHGPFMHEMVPDGKEARLMMHELPKMIDFYLETIGIRPEKKRASLSSRVAALKDEGENS